MTTRRIALVTGANQGLGRAIVEGLASRMSADDTVLLTGRNAGRVTAAAADLSNATARVVGRPLDVTDTAAVAGLADEVRRDYGGIDLVVSNAGARMTPDRSPAEQIDVQVQTSNLGTIRMLQSFLPIVRPGGRFLVVASTFGTLGHLDLRVRPLFEDARSLDDIEAVLESWRSAVHAATAEEVGWPAGLNTPSKVAQVAAVRVVAAHRRIQDLADGTLLASVCPGLFDTDASRPWFADMSQAQTPEQAAQALLQLLLATDLDPTHYGELVRFGQVLPWRDAVPPEASAGVAVQHRV